VKSKQYQMAVNRIERVLHEAKLSREEILCVLAKVTTNAIHVIEERPLRMRVELKYISALRTFSAAEERASSILRMRHQSTMMFLWPHDA